jgi:hypothetical protein
LRQTQSELRAALARSETELARVHHVVDRNEATITETRERLAQVTRALEETTAELQRNAEHANHLDGQIRALLESRTWRWTKPMRALYRVVFGVRD